MKLKEKKCEEIEGENAIREYRHISVKRK